VRGGLPCGRAGPPRPLGHHLVDPDRGRPGRRLLGARHRQQPVDQPGQPGDLLLGGGQFLGGVALGTGGQNVEPQPQRGQRGAQLMGDIGDHRPVAVHQGLRTGRHRVEGGGQTTHLRRSAPDVGPLVQGAFAQPPCGGVQR
jgi:hypothetical protein